MSSVDLPDPDGPSRPTASPRPIFRSMSLRICTRAAPPPSERLTPLSARPHRQRKDAPTCHSCLLPTRASHGRCVAAHMGTGDGLRQIAACCCLQRCALSRAARSRCGYPIRLRRDAGQDRGARRFLDGGFRTAEQRWLCAAATGRTVGQRRRRRARQCRRLRRYRSGGLARLDWSVPPRTPMP